MPHSIMNSSGDPALAGMQLIVPDLGEAIRIATERAFAIMAEDVSQGRFDLNGCILIRDESGATVHVVRFRDLAGEDGSRAN